MLKGAGQETESSGSWMLTWAAQTGGPMLEGLGGGPSPVPRTLPLSYVLFMLVYLLGTRAHMSGDNLMGPFFHSYHVN